jgi:hypothetical protein
VHQISSASYYAIFVRPVVATSTNPKTSSSSSGRSTTATGSPPTTSSAAPTSRSTYAHIASSPTPAVTGLINASSQNSAVSLHMHGTCPRRSPCCAAAVGWKACMPRLAPAPTWPPSGSPRALGTPPPSVARPSLRSWRSSLCAPCPRCPRPGR